VKPLAQTPDAAYRERLAHFDQARESSKRTFRNLGNARLVVALIGVAIAAAAFGPGWISGWWLVAVAGIFVVLAVIHERVDQGLAAANRGVAYYARALRRLNNKWAGEGNSGDRFRSPDHLFADDLDLFGRASLFELLSTARTSGGERVLADWLLKPGSRDQVLERQQAVAELRPRMDLREELALMGEDVRAAADDKAPAVWGALPPVSFFAGARAAAFVLAVLALVTLGLFFAQLASLRPFLVVVLAEMIFGFLLRGPVQSVMASVSTPSRDLELMALLLARIEREHFTSAGLVRLRKQLETDSRPASQQIDRLERLVGQLDAVRNPFFRLVVSPLVWVPQFAMAVENWRVHCGPHIGDWVAAISEFEALCSLACFAYERPDAVFPELLEQAEPMLDAVGLIHPLIGTREAVGNDVSLSPQNRLWIVSGSNMSGKSTLLRAVGVSAVLAWAGAPVTAQKLRVSKLYIGASLRTVDSLADHRSRFYAEISRLRDVMNLAREGKPVLFLFDEVLSGTNSHDRRIGAQALLKKLVELGAIGLVTTHDLALAEIAPALNGLVRNVHFEDYLEGGEVRFDYHLRQGVVTRSNALDLMRAVGLEV
jgi:MutS domain V